MTDEITLWSWVLALSFIIFAFTFYFIPRKHVFPYLWVLSLSIEYINPVFLGQLFTVGKLVPMILLFAYMVGKKGHLSVRSYKLFLPLILLSSYFILSLFWAEQTIGGTQRGFSFVLLFISFWLVGHSSQDEVGLRHFLGAFVMLSMVVSITAIFGFIDNIIPGTLLRFRALKLNPINMSQLIILGTIPLLISILMNRVNNWKWLDDKWFPLVITINMIGLLISTSKTGVLVFFLCILIFFKLASIKKRVQIVIFSLVMAVVIGVFNIWYPVFDNMFLRVGQFTAGDVDIAEQYLPDRIRIWDEALNLFIEYPMFGSGLTSFDPMTTIAKAPHNDILRTLAEGGIVGGVLWISVLVASLTLTIRSVRLAVSYRLDNIEWLARCMLLFVIVVIAFSQSLDMLFNKSLWVIMGMTSSLWGITVYSVRSVRRKTAVYKSSLQ